MPARFSALSGEVPGRSVPCWRSTRNASGVRAARHSASLRVSGKVSTGSVPRLNSMVGDPFPGRREAGMAGGTLTAFAARAAASVQAAGRFTRSANTLRNFSTFGATTARQ